MAYFKYFTSKDDFDNYELLAPCVALVDDKEKDIYKVYFYSKERDNEDKDDETVDFGLPSGNRWMKCNLGANVETEQGFYFVPGESTIHEGTSDFNASYDVFYYNISEVTDMISEYTNDVYQMPTEDDVDELLRYTNQEYISIENSDGNFINGWRFYNERGEIFIPAYCYSLYDSSLMTDNNNIGLITTTVKPSHYSWDYSTVACLVNSYENDYLFLSNVVTNTPSNIYNLRGLKRKKMS